MSNRKYVCVYCGSIQESAGKVKTRVWGKTTCFDCGQNHEIYYHSADESRSVARFNRFESHYNSKCDGLYFTLTSVSGKIRASSMNFLPYTSRLFKPKPYDVFLCLLREIQAAQYPNCKTTRRVHQEAMMHEMMKG